MWNHPFQVEFECSGLHGWPKLMVEVNSVDEHDRIDLCGYGFCHLPMAPGKHTVKIATTRPKGGFWNDLSGMSTRRALAKLLRRRNAATLTRNCPPLYSEASGWGAKVFRPK